MNRTYLCIDLKSFYASVECIERGLDPLTTNLVVADLSRTEKTICLAVTPSLKAHGVSGRARLFEVEQRIKEANQARKYQAPGRELKGASHEDTELKSNPSLAVDYIVAPLGWHIIWKSAQKFIMCISNTLLPRISMYTPLTRYSLT